MKRNAPQPARAGSPLGVLLLSGLLVAVGVLAAAGGILLQGVGFAAMGLAGLFSSPQAHALLGVDYRRRWTPLRVLGLALVLLSFGSFVASYVTAGR